MDFPNERLDWLVEQITKVHQRMAHPRRKDDPKALQRTYESLSEQMLECCRWGVTEETFRDAMEAAEDLGDLQLLLEMLAAHVNKPGKK